MKKLSRILCVLMVIAMVFGSTSIVGAVEGIQRIREEQKFFVKGLDETEDGYVIPISMEKFEEILEIQPEEEIEDIEAYIDRVDNGDGTVTEKIYFEPIKYKDEKGEWQDIDATITKSEKTSEKSTKSAQSPYVSEGAEVKVEFAESIQEDTPFVKIVKEKYSVSMQPLAADGSASKNKGKIKFVDKSELIKEQTERIVTSDKTKLQEIEDIVVIEDTTFKKESYNAIKYEKVFNEDTEIVLEPSGYGLKEDIVLHKNTGYKVYSFELKLDGLYPVLRYDGNTYFLDNETNEIIGVIPTPYMEDSAEEIQESYDIEVQIKKKDDNTYIYELTPSQDWLGAEERIYPVKIDPTYNYSTSFLDTHTNSLNATNKAKNFSSEGYVKMAKGTSTGIHRGYWDFSTIVNSFASGYTINSAYLYLYQDYVGNAQPTLQVYTVASDFNISTVTWNNQPGLGSMVTSRLISNAVGWYAWDVTSIFRTWYSNPGAYVKKLVMKADNETLNMYKRFRSYESGTKPYVAVTHTVINLAPTVTLSGSTPNNATSYTGSWNWGSNTFGNRYPNLYYKFDHESNWRLISSSAKNNGSFTASFSSIPDQRFVKLQIKTQEGSAVGTSGQQIYIDRSERHPAFTNPVAELKDNVSPFIHFTLTPYATTNLYGSTFSKYEIRVVNKKTGAQVYYNSNLGNTNAIVIGRQNPNKSGYTFLTTNSELEPGVTYQISMKSYDSRGYNTANWSSPKEVTTPNFTAPIWSQADRDLTIVYPDDEDASWVQNNTAGNNDNITIRFQGVKDNATGLRMYYRVNGGSWINWGQVTDPVNGPVQTMSINLSSALGQEASDGTYTIELKPMKGSSPSVEGPIKSITYTLDNTKPIITIDPALSGDEDVTITGTVVDGSEIQGPVKAIISSSSFFAVKIMAIDNVELDEDGNFAITIQKDNADLPLVDGKSYRIQILATDMPGNEANVYRHFVVSPEADERVLPQIVITTIEGSEIKPIGAGEYEIKYERADGKRITGTTKLYLNGEYIGTEENGDDFIIDLSTFPDGIYSIHLIGDYGEDTLLYSGTQYIRTAVTGGLPQQPDNKLVYENVTVDANGVATVTTGENSGTITAGKYITGGEYITAVQIEAENTGTVTYQVSFDDGNTWGSIQAGNWVNLPELMDHIKIRATLNSGASISGLTIRTRSNTNDHQVRYNLIEPVEQVYTQSNVNYSVYITWEDSPTEGVTYSVYRSNDNSPDILPGEDPIIEGLTDNYYYDYTLTYGQNHYYKVVAVKTVDNEERKSRAIVQNARVVDEDELDKKFGLQDYWAYVSFSSGSGMGYVHAETGNMVYQKTDITNPSPLLAMVVRRTYNSQATYKTIMGYGWDINYNTTLLEELIDGERVALILKDGDGTIHRFVGNDENGYTTPVGVYMKLVATGVTNYPYMIQRGDGVKYIFNARMQLVTFIEPNGNALDIEYDNLGRIFRVVSRHYAAFDLDGIPQSPGGMSDYFEFYYEDGFVQGTGIDDQNPIGDLKGIRLYTWDGEEPGVGEERIYTLVEQVTYVERAEQYENVERLRYSVEHNSNPGNANIRSEVYDYDDNEQMIQIKNPGNQTTYLDYDVEGRMTTVRNMNGAEAHEYEIEYGSNSIQVTSPMNEITTMELTSWGGISRSIDALENVVDYAYYEDHAGTIVANDPDYPHYSYKTTTVYNKVKIDDEDGSIYSLNEPESFTSSAYYTISQDAFEDGLLEYTIDAMNVRMDVEYTTVTLPGGHAIYLTQETENSDHQGAYSTVTYGYDNKGNVTSITDAKNDTVENQYDSRGNLTSATSTVSGIPSTVSYTYDTKGRLKTTTDAKGWVTTVVEYDSRNNPTRIEDPENRSAQYIYDGFGRLEYVVNNDGTVSRTSYDILGRVVYSGTFENISEARKDFHESTEVLGTNISETIYDDLGRVVRVTYAMDRQQHLTTCRTVNYEYANLSESQNYVTVRENNPGTPTKEVTTYYNAGGQTVRTITDGLEVSYEYDDLGRTIRSTGADDVISWVKYVIDTNNSTTTMISGVTSAEDSNENRETKVTGTAHYNTRGLNDWVEDAGGHTVNYGYDDYGRMTSVSEQVGVYGVTTPQTATTNYLYNQAVNGQWVSTSTAPNGKQTKTYTNSKGQTVKIEDTGYDQKESKTIVQTTTYGYDVDGSLISEKKYKHFQGETLNLNAPENIVEYEYDFDTGNLIRQTMSNAAGTEEKRTEYEYDVFGRVTRTVDIVDDVDDALAENGKGAIAYVIDYEYNKLGELTDRVYQTYTFKQTGATSAGQNEYLDELQGDLFELKNEIEVNYRYNADGQLEVMQYTLGTQTVVSKYVYDSLGRLDKVYANNTNTDNPLQEYNYDSAGRLQYVDTYFGALESGNTKYIRRIYQYDLFSRTTKSSYYLRDKNNSSMNEFLEYSEFEYDSIEGLIVGENYSSSYGSDSVSIEKSFVYDDNHRLASTSTQKNQNAATTTTYGYDIVGNRVHMAQDGFTYSYTYNGLNHLLEVQKKENSALISKSVYGYNDLGSQSEVKEYNGANTLTGTTTYKYDLGNNLKEVSDGTGANEEILSTSYYNGGGQRIRQIMSTETDEMVINYMYMGLTMVASYDDELNPYELNIVGGEIVANRLFDGQDQDYRFYLYDLRGSVTSIIDGQGNLKKGYEYDEFGNTETTDNASNEHNSIAYTGGVYDAATDLYYLNARHYDPNTGRFLQQDTYRGSVSAQWTQHLYAYTGNNPIGMVDPTGHAPMGLSTGGGSGGGPLTCTCGISTIRTWSNLCGHCYGTITSAGGRVTSGIIGIGRIIKKLIPGQEEKTTQTYEPSNNPDDYQGTTPSDNASGYVGGDGFGDTEIPPAERLFESGFSFKITQQLHDDLAFMKKYIGVGFEAYEIYDTSTVVYGWMLTSLEKYLAGLVTGAVVGFVVEEIAKYLISKISLLPVGTYECSITATLDVKTSVKYVTAPYDVSPYSENQMNIIPRIDWEYRLSIETGLFGILDYDRFYYNKYTKDYGLTEIGMTPWSVRRLKMRGET
ncbi:DNRLRE domain-containing protein [Eubacteriales bacterium OttesenSCG-928-N14]|nr:DNRLRE domain-containing protein [Eubacteriales bacterium OttesenSCG-928-N14]